MSRVTFTSVREHPHVITFIAKGDENLAYLGFTEHSFRHTNLVARKSREILLKLGYPERDAELAAIAGYLHDIGNVVGRQNHEHIGASIAYKILDSMGMPPEELAVVIAAIGNHDEQEGQPVNHVSAAVILADKSDVHRSRVRNRDFSTFDIHDRVNYAVEESELVIDEDCCHIALKLKIDDKISKVMEYFEIFLTRMVLCRRAASFLGVSFALEINDARLL
ncbi:MAG TPA: HD domain-containing protein [Firmicutes bacterium]|nr:HD domain-containing protein [Bacillota bacterium]